MKLDILFEDDHILALHKPSGLLSIPDRKGELPSLKRMLEEKYPQIFTVHRLDRDTSGLIVFAKDALTHQHLSKIFEERQVIKIYYGLVLGTVLKEHDMIDAPIKESSITPGKMLIHAKGKPSVTEYWLENAFRNYSFLKFQIHTGRTHQIRVHMQHMGHPIVMDDVYGDGIPLKLSAIKRNFKLSKFAEEEKPMINRLALHAFSLSFEMNGKHYQLEAPLPKEFTATIKQLEKHNALSKKTF